eukprot:ANDGO_05317.mRNA.1 hypothetical protein
MSTSSDSDSEDDRRKAAFASVIFDPFQSVTSHKDKERQKQRESNKLNVNYASEGVKSHLSSKLHTALEDAIGFETKPLDLVFEKQIKALSADSLGIRLMRTSKRIVTDLKDPNQMPTEEDLALKKEEELRRKRAKIMQEESDSSDSDNRNDSDRKQRLSAVTNVVSMELGVPKR